jgi:hypothetical protein
VAPLSAIASAAKELLYRMRRDRLAYATILACAGVLASLVVSRAEPRAVLELFTSQGCSSCPAADRLAGRLALDPQLIVMSIPIDYWDYLGWKDTLALPSHSARQRAYARVRADRQIYTPQMVVNGSVHALGSDPSAIERAIQQTARGGTSMSVPVAMSTAGPRVNVRVAAAKDERASGEVWLCGIAKAVPVTIKRGENRGHTVIYHNVTRRWVKLGDWNGKVATFALATSELKANDVDAAAVFVQSGSTDRPGVMLGAALIDKLR